ncbi:MAG: hypothetical protein LBK42_05730 [Propionibacteriaceae bacterium]|jgi:hypothetical protein|nr:hypothetical protein [Propionibacteriaceae bacterium]
MSVWGVVWPSACLSSRSSDGRFDPAAVEDLLRRAADHLGGGTGQDAAEYLFGLAPDWRLRPEGERRAKAAAIHGVQPDSFRKTPEHTLVEQLAEGVLAIARETDLRQTRLAMETRHPADSRLAVHWVERFEAYYRVWTPAWALAGDLLAAIATRHEPPAPFPPWDPDGRETASHEPEPDEHGNRYHPADQANGYARFALYRYATYQLELKRFTTRHGGLWLLSGPDVEAKVADAIHRVGWHNPLNEEDDAWLRRNLADSRHEEQDHFNQILRRATTGESILDDWQDYVAGCQCAVDQAGELLPAEPAANADTEPACQVHATIAACHDYLRPHRRGLAQDRRLVPAGQPAEQRGQAGGIVRGAGAKAAGDKNRPLSAQTRRTKPIRFTKNNYRAVAAGQQRPRLPRRTRTR